MQITVRITNNFGNRAVYPVCATAQKLAALVNAKTFTDKVISQLKDLGYVIAVEAQTL